MSNKAPRVKIARALSRNALQSMTDKQLVELLMVDTKVMHFHEWAAKGYKFHFQYEPYRKEYHRAKYEKQAIERIMDRRQKEADEKLEQIATVSAVTA